MWEMSDGKQILVHLIVFIYATYNNENYKNVHIPLVILVYVLVDIDLWIIDNTILRYIWWKVYLFLALHRPFYVSPFFLYTLGESVTNCFFQQMGLLCLSHSGYFGDDSTGIMSLIIMMHSRHSVANNSITNTGDNIVAINRRNYGRSIYWAQTGRSISCCYTGYYPMFHCHCKWQYIHCINHLLALNKLYIVEIVISLPIINYFILMVLSPAAIYWNDPPPPSVCPYVSPYIHHVSFSHCNSETHCYIFQVCAPCNGGVLYSFFYIDGIVWIY